MSSSVAPGPESTFVKSYKYNLFGKYFVKRTARGYIFKKDKREGYIGQGSDIVIIPLSFDIVGNFDFSVPREIISEGEVTEEDTALLRADAIILSTSRFLSNYMMREWPDLYIPRLENELLERLRAQLEAGRSDDEIHDEFRRQFDILIATLPALRVQVAREQREHDARIQAMRNAREERGEPVVSRKTLLANFLSSASSISLPCPNAPPAEGVLDPIEFEPFRVGDRVIVVEDNRAGRLARFLFKEEPISRWWLGQTDSYTNPSTGEPIGTVRTSTLLPGFRLAVGRLGPPDPSAPVVQSNPLATDPKVLAQIGTLIGIMDEITTVNPLAAATARSGPRPPSTPRPGAAASGPPGGGAGASSSNAISVLSPLAAAARSGPRPPSTPRPGAAASGPPGGGAGASSSNATSVFNPLVSALRKGGRRRTRNYKKSKRSKTVRKHKRRTHRQRSRR